MISPNLLIKAETVTINPLESYNEPEEGTQHSSIDLSDGRNSGGRDII